jgi:hypothetical protein
MTHLLINTTLSDHSVTFITGPLREELRWMGDIYKEVTSPDGSPVFYDWLRDEHDRIVGIELFLWQEDLGPLRELRVALKQEHKETLQLLFVKDATGKPDGIQGFGDIGFYKNSTGRWLLGLGMQWLRVGDRERLEQLAQVPGRRRGGTDR